MTLVIGSGGGGGGKGGGSGGGTPSEARDNLDSKQFAKVLDLIGEGETGGLVNGAKSIFLNNTPLQNADGTFNFKDVTYEERSGTSSQAYIPLTATTETTVATNAGTITQSSPITRSITDSDVDAVKVTISIPSLQEISDKGDIYGTEVELAIAVQYDGGSFSNKISGASGKISGRTGDLYQRDYLIRLDGDFPVNIKVTRVTADSGSTKLSNAFQWNSYTEIKYDKQTYPNTALVGLRVDAEQFNSIPERMYEVKGIKVKIPHNGTVQSDGSISYSGTFNGTMGAAQVTSDPAWCLYDLLTSSRYGLGDHLDTTQLDVFSFYAASQYCSAQVDDGTGTGSTEPRFSLNCNIQSATEAYTVVNQLCSVFRAMPYWSAGSLTLTQDSPADSSFLFTESNVLEPGFTYSNSSQKTRATVAIIKYFDNDLRDFAYEEVSDSANIARYGSIIKQINAFGCTSRGQANRLGKWLLYMNSSEKETVMFTTSIDAGVSVRPGQVIEIADKVKAGERRGGRITSATTTAITVDDATGLTVPSNSTNELSVVLSDNSVETKTVSSIASGVINVSSGFTSAPNANSIWSYKTTDLTTTTWKVVSVEEQDLTNYAVVAIEYNSGKFAHIEAGVSLTERDVTNLNVQPASPTNLSGLETIYENTGIARVKINLSWTSGTDSSFVRWRFGSGNWTGRTVEGSNSFEILDTVAGNYYVEVYSVTASGLRSATPAKLDPFQAVGKTAAPSQVTGVSLLPIDEASAILSWTRSTELDVLLGGRVLIRHSSLTTAAKWKDAQEIVVAATGSQTQKQVPNLTGTYLLKFADDGGRESPTPGSSDSDWNGTRVTNTLPAPSDRLEVTSFDEKPSSFPGVKTNTVYDSGMTALKLTESGGAVTSSGEYAFNTTVDLSQVYDANIQRRLSAEAYFLGSLWDSRTDLIDTWGDIDDSGGASADKCNAIVYLRTTNDNPSSSPTWSDWQELSNVLVRGRAFQFKAKLTSDDTDQNIKVTELGARVELQGRAESGNDTTGSSAKSITFAKAFKNTPSLSITQTNATSNQQSGDYYDITALSRTGFTVTFMNSSSAVARNFSWSAAGHGKEIT